MRSSDAEALRPTLQHAQATLKAALGEVCRANIDRADTGELIRVEEVLAIANEAAKQAISVRRRLGSEREAATPHSPGTPPPVSREFEDENGVRWSAFEVRPSSSSDRPSVRERFRDGWLSFDSGAETRRVAPIPDAWRSLSAGQLLELLHTAETAARRTRSGSATTPPASPLEEPA